MREQLQPYKGPNNLNYLCILASEFLGQRHLRDIPALMAGFASISSTLPPNVAKVIHNLRLSGIAPATLRELRVMVESYRMHHERLDAVRRCGDARNGDGEYTSWRYTIDDDLGIHPAWTSIVPDDISIAAGCMQGELPLRVATSPALQDPMLSANVKAQYVGYDGIISPLGFIPPAPPQYNPVRTGHAPGFIPWEELVEEANRFDRVDVAAGRQQEGERSWYRRLHDNAGNPTAVLMEASQAGLITARGLDLSGIKHLIGLPGAGKTTILYLLASWLHTHEFNACFLFPSIEVATGFIEKLAQYGIDAGLLYGQGESARNKHVLNFAASMAADNHGFAVTRPIAPFFSTNCALAGFASDEDEDFPHANPPCDTLLQRPEGEKARTKRCCLSSVCGRQYAERELIGRRLWIGHVLSMDRTVSRLFIEQRVRHFEYIARTFDLLVIDECDGAQSALDGRGTPLMKLSGDTESVWGTLLQELHAKAASGRNAFVAGLTIPSIMEMTARFGLANERLVARITHFDETFRKRNANQLLTALSIIADMYPYQGDEDDEAAMDKHRDARSAIEIIWDDAAKQVAFRHPKQRLDDHGDDDDDDDEVEVVTGLERDIPQLAWLCRTDEATIRSFHARLIQVLSTWERDASEQAIAEIARVLASSPGLVPHPNQAEFHAYAALLTTITLLVLQHFGLAPHLRLMNAEGLVSDGVFDSRPSKDQMAILPESLVGRLSGVRYTVSDEGNVDISQVGFAGTPRLLPRRMMDLAQEAGGELAVLLTSATSLLEHSPSFHVDVGPHYVLRRPNAGSGWRNSVYRCLPLLDPLDSERFLQFSGARLSDRERILKAMADQLLRDGTLSTVETAMLQNDVVDGHGRKAGFVVNSYEQCTLLYEHIQANFPNWRGRIRYLVRANAANGNLAGSHGVTASEVEQLGSDRGWDLLIFPMNAIGRGVNIVYRFGPRIDKAMIGSLFFLTRPHPRADSLQLIQGLVGRETERFDQKRFPAKDVALLELREARRRVTSMVERLLRLQLSVQRLGDYAIPFVADLMIIILQTIGRAMRGDCPAFVYFVDSAWAPRSALSQPDTPRTSMLVMMQRILEECLRHEDEATRECYSNLYESFHEPLSRIEDLIVDTP
ncbi:hypothetical protein [Noviherbaspirillum autotrophicum]|uniref:Uncharacterized protein n=1 Tax=Noviherbaspirillum autotrophicum TaxID=709839 RepID=A0A0C1XZ58_9BURK|nr:hypothetical protein [Noviherbaspirillum autotrophicum]KIF80058.1 hypothetical protein TSA66_03285 [Noviherbaspirillum autotrophicum]